MAGAEGECSVEASEPVWLMRRNEVEADRGAVSASGVGMTRELQTASSIMSRAALTCGGEAEVGGVRAVRQGGKEGGRSESNLWPP